MNGGLLHDEPGGRPQGDPATEMAGAALDPEAIIAAPVQDGAAAEQAPAGLAVTAVTATEATPAAARGMQPGHARPAPLQASPLRSPHRLSGLLLAAGGAILFSGKAIIVKLGFRYGADAVSLLALRMLVALPLFLLMAAWAARRAPAPLSPGDRWRVLGLGFFGYYLASYLDFAGLAFITATLERLILYLTPTVVLLIGWLCFGRRPSGVQWLALAVSYLGVGLAFGHDLGSGGGGIAAGAALVFGSVLSYAIYLVGSGEVVGRIGAVRLTAYASSVASVLCIGQFLLLRPLSALEALPVQVHLLSLANGTLCTVLPVLMLMLGVARLGSGLASQVGMLGPVSTIVLSLLVLGEPMGPWQVAGTVLVLGGVLLVSRAPRQKE